MAGLEVIAPIAWNPFSEVVASVLLPRLATSGHALKCVPAHDFSDDGFANSIGQNPQLFEDFAESIFGILNQILEMDFAHARS